MTLLYHLAAVIFCFTITAYTQCGMEICKCEVDSGSNTATADCHGIKINGIPKYEKELGTNTSVETLDLSINMIDRIDHLAFYGLTNLKTLIMSRNYLHIISNTAFKDEASNYSTTIKKMDFSGNDFIDIQPVFSIPNTMPEMEWLSFKNNAIGPILHSQSFFALTNLEYLNLEENKITILGENLFRHFENINTLRLGGNNIATMSKTLFGHGTSLKYLLLQHNLLHQIPPSLPTSLLFLNLAYNRISSLSEADVDTLNNLRELKNLNMSGNAMKTMYKSAFSKLGKLQLLDLSDNSFSYLNAEMFEGVENLQALLLQGNPFLNMIESDTFTLMHSLQYLFLHDCSLQTLEIGNPDTTPYDLTLSVYNGSEYYKETDQNLPPLEMLWMHGNPFYCDCKILPLLWFIKGKDVTVDPQETFKSTTENMNLTLTIINDGSLHIESVCTAPHNRHYQVVDTLLTDLPETYLTCPDQPMYVLISSFLGLALFILVIPVLFLLIFIYLFFVQLLKTYCNCLRPKNDD